MELSIFVAQFPVSFVVQDNLDIIMEILKNVKQYDLVVFPEGCISGYDTNTSFLEKIDITTVNDGLTLLRSEAIKRKIHLWVGSCLFENERWFNAALGFTPKGKINRYNKINLATHERDVFAFGSSLEPIPMNFNGQVVNIGIQLCRDLKYPEQWRWLAMNQAQVFLHLNNAKENSSSQPIWKSQLISRATENQRFVISVNTAASHQECPTMIIDPKGEILKEIISDKIQYFRIKIDLNMVSDWYINQSRFDLIKIKYTKK
ncbi:MAG: carbon-nitrogen hydrolase family protein [Promethearchaeota archaeon]|nr:MAG: carbon-nitrogen hydrolase family protein [Candidatus Lokiarchaeota archaeon]